MLTIIEKLLFLVAVGASIYFSFIGFRKVYRVIMRGSGDKPTFKEMGRRLWHAAINWLFTKPIWKTRPVSSIFHIMISLGFVFYFLVNFGDVLDGMLWDGFTFMGEGWIGNMYRLLADIFTMTVLIGMIYFLIRRFVYRSKALTYHDNIKLMDRIKAGGIQRDSLIVGVFLLCHVGFRLIGDSFAVASTGAVDPFQPFSSLAGQPLDGLERNRPDRRANTLAGGLPWA